MRRLVHHNAVHPQAHVWVASPAWGFAWRCAATVAGATSSLLPPVAELVSHCPEPTPLIDVVKALSAPSLAAIFKHGKGLHGYVQDFGAGVVEIHRGPDGGLRVARAAGQLAPTSPAPEKPSAASSPASPAIHGVSGGVDRNAQPQAAPLGPPCSDEDALITLVKTLFDTTSTGGGHQFIHINTVYQALYPSAEAKATVSVPQLMAFLAGPKAAKHFWVVDLFVRIRLPGEVEAPQLPNTSAAFRVTTAHSGNNYGGWGAASNVPTAADVYEMLKYVPVHWGNMGVLNIPPDVKKRHARTSSILQWFRRQPKYFELRCVAGTVEIRRSVVLHPEEHGMTPAAAQAWLEARIFSGEHNVVTSSTGPSVTSAADNSALSVAQSAILKFLLRVCPPYLCPMALLIQRSTKKSWTTQDLHNIASEHPDKFEVVPTPCGLPLYRRRTGSMARESEASQGVMEDLQSGDNHRMRALLALMSKSCSLWDRPEFLYVRLTDEEKSLVGGYEAMLSLMRAAPRIFHTGARYYCRGDWSNPIVVKQQEREPTDDELLSTAAAGVCACEENPYLSPKELATVFHYVIPHGHPSVSVSFFVESSSPAMKSVLPPRLMDLIQLFPQLFSWRETSPGVFAIRKVQQGGEPQASRAASLGTSDDTMTPLEAIDALVSLIPSEGVEVDTLQTWASLEVNEVLTKEYGSCLRAVTMNPKRFTVEVSAAGKELVRLRATPPPPAAS